MKKDYYMHQQFLMKVDFEDIRLEDFACTDKPQILFDYMEQKNLFDVEVIERCVSLSFLLKEIDDETQWNLFVDVCHCVDRIIIIDDVHIADGNKLIMRFLTSTIKAFVRRVLDLGKDVVILAA